MSARASSWLRPAVSSALMAALLVAPLRAQTTERLVPEVGEPGDIIAIEGTGLADTTQVMFMGLVGGFVGSMTPVVPVISATPTRVEVEVPAFGSFLPPHLRGGQGGQPIGLVTALDAAGHPIGGQLQFYYLEITFGDVQTLGQGSALPGGPGTLAIAFEPHGGSPKAGNLALQLELENAPAGAQAFLAAGLPLAPPFPQLGTGQLVVDLASTSLLIGPFMADATGTAIMAAPVPASAAGVTLALQWFAREPGSSKLLVSNAFVALL
ncbi:MAG TPA: hypothetical protein VFY71_11915 [Planctomycetota bacterium]|nr:hypothetical protein [Planctomycetota bacterium]